MAVTKIARPRAGCVTSVELPPHKIEDSLVFMIESRQPFRVTDMAGPAPEVQRDYRDHWQGFVRRFGGPA